MKVIIVTAALVGTALSTALAVAATPADSLRHRWSLGLQAARHAYVMRYDQRSRGVETFGPLLLSVGYQLRPRWRAEIGASYWRSQHNSSVTFISTDGRLIEYSYDSKQWDAAVPVRARYTLTRQPARRLQVEAVGGVVVAVSRDNMHEAQLEQGQPRTKYRGVIKGLGLAATLGAGARLGLGASRRAEVTADVLLNKNIQPLGRSNVPYGNGYELLGTLALGLRYQI